MVVTYATGPVPAPYVIPKKSKCSCCCCFCICLLLCCCVIPLICAAVCFFVFNFTWYAETLPGTDFTGNTELLLDFENLTALAIAYGDTDDLMIAATSLSMGSKLVCEEITSMTGDGFFASGKGFKCAYDEEDYTSLYGAVAVTIPDNMDADVNIRCTNCIAFALGDTTSTTASDNLNTLTVHVTGGGAIGNTDVEAAGCAIDIDANMSLFSQVNIYAQDTSVAMAMEAAVDLNLTTVGYQDTEVSVLTNGYNQVNISTEDDLSCQITDLAGSCARVDGMGVTGQIVTVDDYYYASSFGVYMISEFEGDLCLGWKIDMEATNGNVHVYKYSTD
ncbi:hypothetical protein KIPB_009812 [Kipferlia bialata]|uniref:Uncharacterized protein n=1 Tax=Kipferlia bialata TaxID=797122 RepID=A0A9K3D4U8_9EUKA|nr:hypothetical protein KIPB_009812 [Kipferlia bialata]|eukprot:g9812.t1